MSDEHGHHHVNYLVIFLILCVCTGMSVAFDLLDISNKLFLICLVLGVAVAKALFVMMYFMHLKFEGKWKYVLLAPTIILACSIPLTLLPDISVHYYAVAAPQERDIRNMLRRIVADEDKANPLSDESLADEMKEKHHYDLRPGTIAHFRASMNIPPAEERRKRE